MPIHKSAIKKVRKDIKRTARNLVLKRKTKTLIGDYKKNPSTDGLQKVQRALFKAVKQNVLHKNTASRLMSRLSKITLKPKASVSPKKKRKITKPTS